MSLYRKVCARGGWISLAASAMLLSLGMVLTLAAAVFGLGFWWEPDQLVSRDYASISECLIQGDGTGRLADLGLSRADQPGRTRWAFTNLPAALSR